MIKRCDKSDTNSCFTLQKTLRKNKDRICFLLIVSFAVFLFFDVGVLDTHGQKNETGASEIITINTKIVETALSDESNDDSEDNNGITNVFTEAGESIDTDTVIVDKNKTEMVGDVLKDDASANMDDNEKIIKIEKETFPNQYAIQIDTKSDKYLTGSSIMVRGTVGNSGGIDDSKILSKIKLEINEIIDGKNIDSSYYEVYKTTFFPNENGTFVNSGFSTEKAGQYIAKATLMPQPNSNLHAEESFVYFDVVPFPFSRVGIGIYAEIIFLSGLLVLIFAQARFGWFISSTEPLRFALLTLCSIIPLIVFVAADVELGADGPLGFVVQTGTTSQWVLNVGGVMDDNYKSGIQVPIFVLIFGIIGGYLRFLRKTSQGWLKHRVEKSIKQFGLERGEELKKKVQRLVDKPFYEYSNDGLLCFKYYGKCENCHTEKDLSHDGKEKICADCYVTNKLIKKRTDYLKKRFHPEVKRAIFNNAMQDFALIFLPPILALVFYFILMQGGFDVAENKAMFTLSSVSLGIGLITKEALERIEDFVGGAINNKAKEENASLEVEVEKVKAEIKGKEKEKELEINLIKAKDSTKMLLIENLSQNSNSDKKTVLVNFIETMDENTKSHDELMAMSDLELKKHVNEMMFTIPTKEESENGKNK